ncbi:SEC-C metal-binding domain-containing protein [Persicobacter diffluens]|uniref:Uncharacterized protein n=1 Tax=Persicobacter diffluens TaxID=981 RepID=A0AAN4VXB3_9BACT|nr:hypothetical protein PEDI_12150 [Persicobacter diffluens]
MDESYLRLISILIFGLILVAVLLYFYRKQNGGEDKNTIPKVHRNDPCPCGSGKKYKQCCGK